MKKTLRSKSHYTQVTEETYKQNQSKNLVHQTYQVLLNNLVNEYSHLSKIIYLSIILNASCTIYTSNPEQVQDIYRHICLKLKLKQLIYHCGPKTSISQILKNKQSTKVYLLYDLSALDTTQITDLRKFLNTNVVINIESTIKKELSYTAKEFSMMVVDKSENNFKQFIKKLDEKPTSNKIELKKFEDIISKNSRMAQDMANSRFVKIYLQAFQFSLSKHKIKFPHSRWKKSYQLMKIIGLNKSQNQYKSLCLVDCIFVPWFLSTSLQEYDKLSDINFQIICKMAVYYGAHKFLKHLSKHFFISQQTKKIYSDKIIPFSNQPSFFYPCDKYPNLVTLQIQEESEDSTQFFYKILGERKLMSDRYIEVMNNRAYTLQLDIRANTEVDMEVGIACYDKNKQLIVSKNSFSKQGTQVTVKQIQNGQIVIQQSDIPNLKNWNIFQEQKPEQERHGYNFCIGMYTNSQLEPSYILKSRSLTEGNKQNCGYKNIDFENGRISISQHLLAPLKYMCDNSMVVPHKTRIVNYVNYPVYKTAKVKTTTKWSRFQLKYSKQCKINSICDDSIQYVRIILIVEQHLSDKSDKFIHLKNIQFRQTST